VPTLQSTHAVDEAAPSEAECLPGRHPAQLEAPAAAAYWPAAQLTQEDASVAPALVAAEALPAAHWAQVAAPSAVE